VSAIARRMFELVEPIGMIPYSADEPNEPMFALGFTNYWDPYSAGRPAPLGIVPAEVVDGLFYNFAPGGIARPSRRVAHHHAQAGIAARRSGCAKAPRRILGDHVHSPAFARAKEMLTPAATSAPLPGRPIFAALRALSPCRSSQAAPGSPARQLRDRRLVGHRACGPR
jgi:hypothetical protein